MTNVPIKNLSDKQVGFFNTDDKTYYRLVNRKQQFVHPKYEGMLAISRHIMRQLALLKCKLMCFTLQEWENQPFDAVISFEKFNDHREELHFAGKRNSDFQYGVRLQHWTRRYKGQKLLPDD